MQFLIEVYNVVTGRRGKARVQNPKLILIIYFVVLL